MVIVYRNVIEIKEKDSLGLTESFPASAYAPKQMSRPSEMNRDAGPAYLHRLPAGARLGANPEDRRWIVSGCQSYSA